MDRASTVGIKILLLTPVTRFSNLLPSRPNYSYTPKGCDNGTNVVALGCTSNRHPTEYQAEAGSEDELINELQGDNLCVQQLRHSLFTEPRNSGGNNKVPVKHKLASVLKYHMSRF